MNYLTLKTTDEEIQEMAQGYQTIEERLFDIRNYLKKDNFDPYPWFEADVKKAYWLLYNIGHADDVFIDFAFGAKAIVFNLDEDYYETYFDGENDGEKKLATESILFTLGQYH